MRSQRPYIEQRRVIFVGCEGESEHGYAALLQLFARDFNLPIFLKIEALALGAGDPYARLIKADKSIEQLQKKGSQLHSRFLLMDSDQADRDPVAAEKVRRFAESKHIAIIWQAPCFEAMLLRHFVNKRPADSTAALRELLKVFPGYRKGMAARILGEKISWKHVIHASQFDPSLKKFLTRLGFPIQ